VIGDDVSGKILKTELAREKLIEQRLIVDPDRPTTRKARLRLEQFFNPYAARRLGAGDCGV